MTKHEYSNSSLQRESSFGAAIIGWIIIVMSVALATFVISALLNPWRVKQTPKPLEPITIQVLNGCGIKGAADALSDALLKVAGPAALDIIEKGDTELYCFEKTVIIDRNFNAKDGTISSQAGTLASCLAVDETDVLKLKLSPNILGIDVTIIAGKDYYEYVKMLDS